MHSIKKYYFFLFIIIALSAISCRSSKETIKNSEGVKVNRSKSSNYSSLQKKYAALLGVEDKKIDNIPLYSFINEWYGVPYKYGGKNKNGIDCSNFTTTLYDNVYHKSIIGTSSSIFNQCKIISQNNLTEGDLLFFKIESNDISHIGVYLQNNKFVHATTKKGVMIDDLDEPYYKKYFYKAGRIK